MRLYHVFLILPMGAAAGVDAASTNETFIEQETALAPTCGLTCLFDYVPQSGCGLLDSNCQCNSTLLANLVTACVNVNCSLPDTLAFSKIQAAICELPDVSRVMTLRVADSISLGVGNVAALARVCSRYFLHTMALDDWFIIAAAISHNLFIVFGLQLEVYGFGAHIWDLSANNVVALLHTYFICEILYIVTIGLVKGSILLFYLRVFPIKSIYLSSWAVFAYCAASTIAFTIVIIFQCNPVEAAWNKNITTAVCINYNAASWANAAINIQQDLLIIILPINALRRLHLTRKKMLGLYAMFTVGGFVCIISVIRLVSLRNFGLTNDPTWDNVPTSVWSGIETGTAIFCASMPAMRAGVVSICPKIWAATRTADNSASGGQQSGSANIRSLLSFVSTKSSRRREPIPPPMFPTTDEGPTSEVELVIMQHAHELPISDEGGKSHTKPSPMQYVHGFQSPEEFYALPARGPRKCSPILPE